MSTGQRRRRGGPVLAPLAGVVFCSQMGIVLVPPSKYFVNDLYSKNIVEKYLFTP